MSRRIDYFLFLIFFYSSGNVNQKNKEGILAQANKTDFQVRFI